jgi:hypothetical protein
MFDAAQLLQTLATPVAKQRLAMQMAAMLPIYLVQVWRRSQSSSLICP